MSLSFHKILDIYGINPPETKLVRHSDAEIPILETFKNNLARFEKYQSFQTKKKFGTAAHLAVFAPSQGTSALFLGIWNIVGCTENADFGEEHCQLLNKYDLPAHWFTDSSYYHLERNPILDELSERIVIDWGGSTVSWVQNKDKLIIELRRQNSIGKFVSYDEVQISYQYLKALCGDRAANIDWVNALSAVNGIYLIKDCSTGKLYVGSAYGENGIFNRWSAYAANGHGGNKELKKINPNNFEFSILEIVSGTVSESEVIHREKRWKLKLGTREFGLNLN
jgi:hypothetical protein